MDNLVFIRKDLEVEGLCRELGFNSTAFLDEVALVSGADKKEVFKKIEQEKKAGKIVVYKAGSEELLR